MSGHPYLRTSSIPLRFGGVALLLGLSMGALAQSAPDPKPSSQKISIRDKEKAEQAYLSGARFIDRRDLAQAEVAFKQAETLNPAKPEYAQALARTRDGLVAVLAQQAAKARLSNQPGQADTLLARARAIDPNSPFLNTEQTAALPRAQIVRRETADNLEFAGPIELAPSRAIRAFQLRGDRQEIVRQVADAYGIKASFDESVGHGDLRFGLEEAPYSQSMAILLHVTHLFAVVLDPHSIFVVKDTQENRQKFERQIEETIFVPGSTNEEMTELINIVKNVFDVKQVSVLNGSGTMLVRAPETTLKVMNYTLADLLDGGAEVMLELKLYEVDKSFTRNTGASLPTQYGAFSLASEAQSIVSSNQTLVNQAIASGAITLTGSATQNLITEALYLVASGIASNAQVTGLLGLVGGGLTSLGVYEAGSATFNLSLNSSDVRTIDDVQTRVDDRQISTLKVGSKYPITTSTYSTSAASSSLTASLTPAEQALVAKYLGTSTAGTTTTTPQVQYEDLGLTLKTTPTVEKSGLVALHVELKIEALTGSSLDGNPILSSRALTSDVTVRDGATAVMLSDLNKNETGSLNGVPGLSDLPGFQDATDVIAEQDSTELVLTITPHVVRRRANEIASPRIAFQTSTPPDY